MTKLFLGRYSLGFVFLLSVCSQSFMNAGVLLDEIVARVNDTNICRSDLLERQMHLGGQSRSLDACIQDELFFQKAHHFGAVMREDELEKRMVALRAGYGFGYHTQAEFESFLKKAGLSFKRLQGQVKRSGSISSVQGALMPKDALVTRKDVESFCVKHPEIKNEEYLLSFATGAKNLLAQDGSVSPAFPLVWTELDGWMKNDDLADNMSFVRSMNVGEVSAPVMRGDSFFVYRLEQKNDKRLLSVDERYAEVEKILLKERKAEKEIEIKGHLKEEAAITILPS